MSGGPSVVGAGTEKVGRQGGDKSHPLNLHGWWHSPRIPTRGEEGRGGLSLSPGRKSAGLYSTRGLSYSNGALQRHQWGAGWGGLGGGHLDNVIIKGCVLKID